MREYKIEVTSSMMKSSDFLTSWNGDNPMPLKIMYGVKLKETKGMVYMQLHGDIKDRITRRCMCCGREITNPVSQYFGIGPICGEHNYTNPFASEEELNQAVEQYRTKLVNTVWTGWIVKKWIESIDDDCDIYAKLAEMPYVVNDKVSMDVRRVVSATQVINARVDKPVHGTDDFSAFLSFKYNPAVIDTVKTLPLHCWNSETKEWEINYSDLDSLKLKLPEYRFEVTNAEIVPETITIPADYAFKTTPMSHQAEGVRYGLKHNRWLLADEQGLGKTKEIIDLAVVRKKVQGFKHCLIVCGVNSLKWNWLEEIEKHSDESGWILGMYQSKRTGKWRVGGNAAKLKDLKRLRNGELDSHYFIIINIESIRNSNIAITLNELCNTNVINLVAIDEIHRCFDYGTLIYTDRGYLKIGDIVTKNIGVNVKSYNPITHNVEWKPIVGRFENPVAQRLLELTIDTPSGIKVIRCTDCHLIYTQNRGWVKAKDLLDTDILLGI